MALSSLLSASPTLNARMAHIALGEWRRAVGERLAQKTLPERLDERTLTVRVPSSTWAQELSMLSQTVVERLRSMGHSVDRLRFHVVAQQQPVHAPVLHVERAELPMQLRASLERIDDLDLRSALGQAAAYSLGRRPNRP